MHENVVLKSAGGDIFLNIMNMTMYRSLMSFLGLFLLSSQGSALYCYYCNDFLTGLLNCSDPFLYNNMGVKIQYCQQKSSVCYKYLITHMGHTFHARSCHPGNTIGCYQRNNVTVGEVLECFCRGDFCNSAVKIQEDDIVSLLTKFLFVIHMLIK